MCILAICENRSLSKQEFFNCFALNPDGVGFAWSDGTTNKFVKKLYKDYKEAYKEYIDLPFHGKPHVVHFRLASVGDVMVGLSHPFVISKFSKLVTKYAGDEELLFHNGTYYDWENLLEQLLRYYPSLKEELVDGKISDTRLLAINTALKGKKNNLQFFKEAGKIVIWDKGQAQIYGKFIEDHGVLFSNTGYKGIITYPDDDNAVVDWRRGLEIANKKYDNSDSKDFYESINNKSLLSFYLEKLDLHNTNTIKYYAFDWDDNLQKTTSKIHLVDKDGNIVKRFTTAEFAEVRQELDEKKKEGYTLSYIEFKDDNSFLDAIKNAVPMKAWPDFVECINNGSLFAIITARGHSPQALKKAVKWLIENNKDGLNKQELIDSLKEYRGTVGHKTNMSDDDLINEYLNDCKFYPVSYHKTAQMLGGGGDASSPEKLKVAALKQFIQHIKGRASTLVKKIGNKEIALGFSDDDAANIEAMNRHRKEFKIKKLKIKHTK